jgi:hypothetical protein
VPLHPISTSFGESPRVPAPSSPRRASANSNVSTIAKYFSLLKIGRGL